MSVTAIPYLMTSVSKIKAFVRSDAAKLLDSKLEAKGVKNIGWLVDANDGMFTSAKAPLLKPEDYRGIKIRGLNKLFDTGLQAWALHRRRCLALRCTRPCKPGCWMQV